jgi:hypothetical protein
MMIDALFVNELKDDPGEAGKKTDQGQDLEFPDEMRLHEQAFYSGNILIFARV